MSASTEVLVSNSSYRPSANSVYHKTNIINHFQNSMQISNATKKSPSLTSTNRIRSNDSQHSYSHKPAESTTTAKTTTTSTIKQQQSTSTSQQIDSRNANNLVRNHVQFVLPLNESYRSNTPTNNSNSNFFTKVLTPTDSNSSINNTTHRFSEFKSLNKESEITKSMTSGLNRLSNTTPLKNLTSIRSSSFRNKNSVPNSTTTAAAIKYEPSKPAYPTATSHNFANNLNSANGDFMNKNRSCKSFESINNILKPVESKQQPGVDPAEKTAVDANTHNIHRLIKMATNWNSRSKGQKPENNGVSGSSKSNYVMSDRSLPISQTKIRQTQTFLNDENKIDAESALSRKMQEISDKSNKVSHPSIDEAFADALSDKSVRMLNGSSRQSNMPIRILPMNVNRLSEMSKTTDHSSKKSVQSLLETNDFSSSKGSNHHHHNNHYWSSSNGASEMGDNSSTIDKNTNIGSSVSKESSISNYLSRGKPISFMSLNKNFSSGYKASSTQSGLNRIAHGLPIHIQ